MPKPSPAGTLLPAGIGFPWKEHMCGLRCDVRAEWLGLGVAGNRPLAESLLGSSGVWTGDEAAPRLIGKTSPIAQHYLPTRAAKSWSFANAGQGGTGLDMLI